MVTLEELQRLELFQCLQPDTLQKLADRAEKRAYAGEEVIVRQGEPGKFFYVVLSGQVEGRQASGTGQAQEIGAWGAGEFFGADVLLESRAWDMTVAGVIPGELLQIDASTFQGLRKLSPEWAGQLSALVDLRAAARRQSFEGQEPDEINLVFARRIIYALIEVLIAPALVALFLLMGLVVAAWIGVTAARLMIVTIGVAAIFLALWVWYAIWDWHNDELIVTNKRVIHIERRPLVSASREEAPIQRVQQVTTESPSLSARILGYKTLNVQTASMNADIIFWGLGDADWISTQVRTARDKANARYGLEKQQEKRKYLSRKLGLAAGSDVPAPGSSDQGGDGKIVWHRHWWVLVRKVSVPVLAAAAYLAAWILTGSLELLLSGQATWWAALLFFGPLVLFGLWLVWRYMDWYYDYYAVTNTEIIDHNLLLVFPLIFREKKRIIAFDSVQNVDSEVTGIVHRLLRLGHVRLSTTGGGDPVTFDSVYQPQRIQQTLFGRLESFRERQRERETQQRSEELGEWFAAYREVMGQPPQPGRLLPPDAIGHDWFHSWKML